MKPNFQSWNQITFKILIDFIYYKHSAGSTLIELWSFAWNLFEILEAVTLFDIVLRRGLKLKWSILDI